MAQALLHFPASAQEIRERREKILDALCEMETGFSSIPISSLSSQTLMTMLQLYDTLFFQGILRISFRELKVTLSPRLISAAGKFIYARSTEKGLAKAEIRMSSDFLFRLSEGPFALNGLTVKTPQEAFLIVFEHELCHALETALYGKTDHGSRFMTLAGRFFGHTAATHQLPTRRMEAARSGIRVGAFCTFVYKDTPLKGQITYIGKTATVMVQSSTGEYKDRRGRRYTKYRVPLSQLVIR